MQAQAQVSHRVRWFVRSVPVSLLVMVFCIASSVLAPATATAAHRTVSCEWVAGTVEGIAVPIVVEGNLVGFDVTATAITGPLSGSMTADIEVERITPSGAIHFTGVHTFLGTEFGDFQTSDKGLVTSKGHVINGLTLVGPAKGFIASHGMADLASGALDLRYVGRVCV